MQISARAITNSSNCGIFGRTFSPASFPTYFIRCGIAPCIRYLAHRASESCFIVTGYFPGMRLRSAVLFKS